MSPDGVNPISLIRNISRDFTESQPINIISRINRWHYRFDARPEHVRVFVAVETLGRPKIPDGREPRPGRIGDEIMISEDEVWREQGRGDSGNLLNGNLGSEGGPGFVQGFLDSLEEGGRRVV